MAKRRRKVSGWETEERGQLLDTMFEAMRQQAQHEMGDSVSLGTESGADLVGLPLPALCLRYLFQSSVFPLSRIAQIVGEEGSAKSAFLYEIFRWHMLCGGGAVLAENESKDSPELRNAILEWRSDWLSRLVVKPTYTLEEWQDVFSRFTDILRKQQDAADGPGRTVPVCLAVDSIMATAPQSEIDQVRKEGHAVRGHALAANLIARYMRTMPDRIRAYPFTVVGTNHLKPGTDARGFPIANVPGGKAVKFMETYEIEMRRAPGGHDIDKLEYQGLRVVLRARKNSLGPSRKQITAELLWWYEPQSDGEIRQRVVWDWDTATVELLLSFEAARGKKTIFNRLRDVTGIQAASKSQRTAWSEQLDIPRSDPQPYRVVGRALEERPELLREVYQVLGITERQAFVAGTDYRDLLEQARAASQVKAEAESQSSTGEIEEGQDD